MSIEINWGIQDVNGQIFSFKNIDELKEFAKSESEFWETQWKVINGFGDRRPHAAINCYGIWNSIASLLESWTANFSVWDQATITSQLNSQFSNWTSQLSGQWLWSGHPISHAWAGTYKLSQATGDAFYEACIDKRSSNYSQFESFRGYILAYEFQMQDETNLVKRRVSEEKSFSRLRSQLVDKKTELVNETSKFQSDLNEFRDSIKDSYSTWHSATNDSLDKAETKRVDDFTSAMETWEQKISDLNAKFHALLQLKAPSAQWLSRAKVLRFQAGLWIICLVATSALALFYGHDFFTIWLQDRKLPLKLDSFQGAIIFASIASIIIFLIKTFARLAFSAFHLQRDAEERAQLAYVYLALIDETEVDPESKKIVLQSLFSRAETGLLGGDSGPTMPITDIVRASRPGHSV